jgi:hypothetical protein
VPLPMLLGVKTFGLETIMFIQFSLANVKILTWTKRDSNREKKNILYKWLTDTTENTLRISKKFKEMLKRTD